jgi:glutamate transport system permease protein
MSSVLYDAQGPKARRNTLIGTVVAALVVLALVVVVAIRLADRGQFEWELWAPFLDPSNEAFDAVWELLGRGLLYTLQAAAIAMALSLVLGTLIAVARLQLGRTARIPLVGVVEVLRGAPVVILVFLCIRSLPEIGIDFRSWYGGRELWGLVIGLTLYNMVVFAEIVRAGVQSLPRGQREAALATGLTQWQTMRLVLLPQAFRVMLPALISQLVVVLKDTSLVAIVGNYPELLGRGEDIQRNLDNPIQTFVVVALIFIALNFALGKLAEAVQGRQSRSGRRGTQATQATVTGTGA